MVVKNMKKLFVLAVASATLVGCGVSNSSLFNETATDLLGNNGIELFNAFDGEETIGYSQTFTQYGVNPKTKNLVLRFATAVKGDIENLTYTRAAIDGVKAEHVKEVKTVYAGIMAGGSTQYYTDAGLSEDEADKGQYYWACYSIEFANPSQYSYDISVTFSVNGEVVNNRDANLQDMIDESNRLYKSIYIDGDVNVPHGQNVNTANLVVKAVNHDGSELVLDPSDYTIMTNKVARFGEKTTLEVVHNQEATLVAAKDVTVVTRVEGENGTIVGGKKNTEAEYTINDGSFVKGSNVSFAGNFVDAVESGQEATLTLSYFSKTAHVGGFKMKVSNSNLHDIEANQKQMNPLQLNTICDLSVNGNALSVENDVVIPGTPVYTGSDHEPLYGVYNIINIENVSFLAGKNTLKFKFKTSTIGEVNSWGETPSTFNIDYVDFYSTGSEIGEINYAAGLTLDTDNFAAPSYGTEVADVIEALPSVFATTTSGEKVAFERNEVNATISGGNHDYMVETEEYIVFGDQTINFNLIDNEDASGSYTFTVKEYFDLEFTKADIRISNGRVYYVLSGTSHGYRGDELEFFDGNNVLNAELVFNLNEFYAYIDVTDTAASKGAGTVAFYPHLRINGKNYVAPSVGNSSGDVKGQHLNKDSYHNKTLYLNNKRYRLIEYYGMPIVSVSTFDYGSSDAFITDVSLVWDNDHLYYQVTGYAYNITDVSKIEVFDGDAVLSSKGKKSIDSTTGYFVIKCYLNRSNNSTFYPHIRINGSNYAASPTNGDLKNCASINYRTTIHGNKELPSKQNSSATNIKTETYSGKKYSLYILWGMPVLECQAA